MADAYLPVTVRDIPVDVVFDDTGAMRPNYAHAARLGVARIIAGPTLCDVVVDIRRPYYRPLRLENKHA